MKQLLCLVCSAFISLHSVSGQVSVKKSEFKGRQCYSLQNNKMRITLLTGGAYIAELRLISPAGEESINPMFIPHYKTIDPHTYHPEMHKELYGVGKNGKLMAGYMGHYLCFPYFGGGVSSAEEELGYSTHGEAYTVQYEVEDKMLDPGAVITASAMLPLTKYSVSRSLTLLPGQSVVRVEEVINNLENVERPYHWVQHVTFGAPFIEFGKTFVDAPVTKIAFSPQKDDPSNINTLQWPIVSLEEGRQINVGVYGSDQGEGAYRAWLMDPDREFSWFTIYNQAHHLLVGYIFSKEENPWIGDWQENRRLQTLPRDGETVAWGLEVGTTPFGGGPESIEREPVFDTKTFGYFGPNETKEQSYLIFLLEIDDDFKGVKELKLEEGAIVLVEKENAKQIRVANSYASF